MLRVGSWMKPVQFSADLDLVDAPLDAPVEPLVRVVGQHAIDELPRVAVVGALGGEQRGDVVRRPAEPGIVGINLDHRAGVVCVPRDTLHPVGRGRVVPHVVDDAAPGAPVRLAKPTLCRHLVESSPSLFYDTTRRK